MYINDDGETVLEPGDGILNTSGLSSGQDYQILDTSGVVPTPPVVANLDFTAQPSTPTVDQTSGVDSWLHDIENGLNSIGQLATGVRTLSTQAKTIAGSVTAPATPAVAAKTVSPTVVYVGLAAAALGLYFLLRGRSAA